MPRNLSRVTRHTLPMVSHRWQKNPNGSHSRIEAASREAVFSLEIDEAALAARMARAAFGNRSGESTLAAGCIVLRVVDRGEVVERELDRTSPRGWESVEGGTEGGAQ